MTRWADLKKAFWRIAESEPAERARALEALAGTDPDLYRSVKELLIADAREEPLLRSFAPQRADQVPPSRIGVYEITGVIGTGGMGEVYRAHDTRLKREVAIKILPRTLTTDHERRRRFEQEARTLALLNHAHVAQVYGLEESAGTPALVMELVEGPTLQQFIASHAGRRIGLHKVLALARQIADGLDAAHEKGIIHSDLKPGNIALTPDGDVKILDFGIARNLADADSQDSGGAPSLGGTPAYMSPEQARGLPFDKRTDIWAFGCVLYELIAGHRPPVALTTTGGVGASSRPDLTAVPEDTPAALRTLIGHCLEPDPRRRLRDVADARLAIEDILSRPADHHRGAAADRDTNGRRGSGRQALFVGIPALIAGAAIAGAAVWFLSSGTERQAVVSTVSLPRNLHRGQDVVISSADSWFAVSPDARRLVVVAAEQNARERLWVRELADDVFRPLPDTEGASYPFWSPDSKTVAFIAQGRLKRTAVSGGTPVTIAEGGYRSGAWGRNDVILIAPAASSPLHRITADGESTAVTTLDHAGGEVQHTYPALLPDGRHFLYVVTGGKAGTLAAGGVYLKSLDGAEPATLLLPGATRAQYASGHVLFLRNGQLMAQPFDEERLQLRGTARPLVEQVKTSTSGATGATGTFSASDTGLLVYQALSTTTSQPIWFDRTGVQLATAGPVANHTDLALSRDGTRLALGTVDVASRTDLWIYEANGHGRRFTSDNTDEFGPVWSPDSRRILFSVQSKQGVDLFVKAVGEPSVARPLQVDSRGLGRFALDWSRDFFLYVGGGRAINRSDLWIAPVANPSRARPLLDSTFVETHGLVAPRGAWFVYTSNETGRLEVYVDRFPHGGSKRQVSTDGGAWPRWSRDGDEIYYVSRDNRLMAARVAVRSNRIDSGPPQRLFSIRPRPSARLDAYAYDVAPDGRFIVNTLADDPGATTITLSQHWTAGIGN